MHPGSDGLTDLPVPMEWRPFLGRIHALLVLPACPLPKMLVGFCILFELHDLIYFAVPCLRVATCLVWCLTILASGPAFSNLSHLTATSCPHSPHLPFRSTYLGLLVSPSCPPQTILDYIHRTAFCQIFSQLFHLVRLLDDAYLSLLWLLPSYGTAERPCLYITAAIT